jgi:ketosteroid isomerase-like protein
MSKEDIELATRAIRAVMARPEPDFETMNEVFDPDHVYVPTTRAIDAEEYRGGRGYQQFLREEGGNIGASDAALVWDEADLEGVVDVGNHRVIAVTAARFRGKRSGVDFEQRIWVVMTVRDGRICRTESHTDPTEALKAAGLSEKDAQADS